MNDVHLQSSVREAQVKEQTPAPRGLVHPAATRSLWFDAAEPDEQVRRTLTRERVAAEALLLIAEQGVEALTMRTPGRASGGSPRRALPPRPQQGAAAGPDR